MKRNNINKQDNINNYKHKIAIAGAYIIGLILFTKMEYDNYKDEQEFVKAREKRRKDRRDVK